MANTPRKLMTITRQRQIRYIGHVFRGNSLVKDGLLGMMEGRRAGGRQRTKYMDGIKALLGCDDIGEVMRLSERRKDWRISVAHVN